MKNNDYKKEIENLKEENKRKSERIKFLEERCEEKEKFFLELMSDALRHGSHLAAKHMEDRKEYLSKNNL